jgi:hypothetical protein
VLIPVPSKKAFLLVVVVSLGALTEMILVLFKILFKFPVSPVRLGTSPALEVTLVITAAIIIFELGLTPDFQLRVQITFYALKSSLGGKKHLLGVLVIWVQIWVELLGLNEILFFYFTHGRGSTYSKQEVGV